LAVRRPNRPEIRGRLRQPHVILKAGGSIALH
jgi:hypothetical protein